MNDEKFLTLRFDVLWESLVVGSTELEHGDPPMGVATGRFHPSENYALLRERCQLDGSVRSGLQLRVRHREGRIIDCAAGVFIEDSSEELGLEAIEVSVLGIGHLLYEELFPQHVVAYDAMFSAKGNGSP